MSLRDICQFWRIMESLVRSSEACCHTFVQSDGLRHLISTMKVCSRNYEFDQSIIKVVGQIATTKGLKQALHRQEVLNYLKTIVNFSCYKNPEVCLYSNLNDKTVKRVTTHTTSG